MGRAVATRFAREGMRVVAIDIEAEALESVRATLSDLTDVVALRADVSDRAAWSDLTEQTIEAFGRIDVVHLNAGVVAAGPVEDLSLEVWDWVLGVDLWGVIYGVRAFLAHLKRQDQGHIIATASTCGIQSATSIAPYNVAKFGVVALMETVRRELESVRSNVGCSVLIPGAVNTRIVHSTRNMPAAARAAHRPSDMEAIFVRYSEALLSTEGLDPAVVADLVHDAVIANRFWIVTHPGWFDIAEARAAGMRHGELRTGFGG
jgi:NAD(P)-dependent dehydrogenase (short-subunit alcohol dehydrogenase family)